MRTVILLAIGFPIALGFARMFELTPEGLKPRDEVERLHSITRRRFTTWFRLIHAGNARELARLAENPPPAE